MSLALATSIAGTGQIQLDVTGAAHVGAAAYTSDFSAGVDSWTGGSAGSGTPTLTGAITVGGLDALRIGSACDFFADDQYGQRTVSGLTIGQTYRVRANLRATAFGGPLGYLGVSGIGFSDGVALSTTFWYPTSYDFVATGTSHVVQVKRSSGSDSSGVYVSTGLDVVLLASGGLDPCYIERSDANGTHFVRLADGQDVDSSGAMTVIDNEAAIYGSIAYQVRDGLGNSALASTTLVDPDGNPLLSEVGVTTAIDIIRVDGYDGTYNYAQQTTNVKAVIGRADALVQNSEDYGWTTRQGTLTLYAGAYDTARRIIATYKSGRVLLLRQNSYGSGFDLYHVATSVKEAPGVLVQDSDDLTGLAGPRWTWPVVVNYVETGWVEGALVGPEDWSYAALSERYLTYADVKDAFNTYADLASDSPL